MNPIETLTSLLVILFLAFISVNAQAISPGTYNHKTQTAYIEVYDNLNLSIDYYNETVTIIAVDFKNKKITRLVSGNDIGWLAINHDGTILSYSDITGTHFIDSKDGRSLFNVKMTMLGGSYWASDRNILAMEGISIEPGENDRNIIEIDVNHKSMKSVKLKDVIWYVKWSNNCACFLYEVSDGIVNARRTVKLQDHNLHNLKNKKNLTLSKDGKYYYSIQNENDDDAGTFEVFRASDNKSVTGPYSALSSPRKAQVLWGINTIRLLGKMSLFDLKTGNLLSSPVWFSKKANSSLLGNSPYDDVAADRSQYVLRWNDNKNNFEVEDINTGKIVRKYKQFW